MTCSVAIQVTIELDLKRRYVVRFLSFILRTQRLNVKKNQQETTGRGKHLINCNNDKKKKKINQLLIDVLTGMFDSIISYSVQPMQFSLSWLKSRGYTEVGCVHGTWPTCLSYHHRFHCLSVIGAPIPHDESLYNNVTDDWRDGEGKICWSAGFI